MSWNAASRFILLVLIAGFVAIAIIAPLCMVLIDAFVVRDASGIRLTADHFLTVLSAEVYWTAIFNTTIIALLSCILATTLGVGLGWVLVRTDIPAARLLEKLAIIPIFIPPFVGAFAWILLAAPRIGLINYLSRTLGAGELLTVYSHLGIAWVIGIYLAPYVLMIVASALRSMDPSLEEAGQVAGLTRFRTAMTVTLPVVAPAILSGAMLAFVITIGLFGTPVLLGWTKQIHMVTSRIYIESIEQPPNYAIMAVLAIILILMSATALLLQRWILANRSYVTVTGKGFRSRPVRLGQVTRAALFSLVVFYIILTVIGPIVVIIGAAVSTYTWSGVYTFENITKLWLAQDVISTFRNSLVITLISATLAIVFGLCVSWITTRTKIRGRGVLEYLVMLPVSVPGIAFAVGVLFLWLKSPIPVYGTLFIIVIALVGRFSGYAVRNISSSLIQVHPELEECARVSGYGPLRTLTRITLPLIAPSITSSWILLYSIFITELSMVILLQSANTRTFSILSFEVWYTGLFPQVASLSLFQLIVGVVVMYCVQFITRPRRLAS